MTVAESLVIPPGVYTPVPTFFKGDSYELDLESQVKHAKFLYESGITGLVVTGSMGEAPHLTRAERNLILKSIREAVPDKNFKLIAGAPPMSIQDTIDESFAAKENGADFVIYLIQGYFGPGLISQEGIVDYFYAIADKTALPICIYNYPGTCNNVDIKPDVFVKLAKHPMIVAAKLTHFNLAQANILINGTTNENFQTFTGLGQVFIPALSIGAVGTIDGLSGMFPKVMLNILKLFKEKNYEKALKLQNLAARGDEMIFALNVVGVKYALYELYGFGDKNTLTGRPPLNKSVNLEVYKTFAADLAALKAAEESL